MATLTGLRPAFLDRKPERAVEERTVGGVGESCSHGGWALEGS